MAPTWAKQQGGGGQWRAAVRHYLREQWKLHRPDKKLTKAERKDRNKEFFVRSSALARLAIAEDPLRFQDRGRAGTLSHRCGSRSLAVEPEAGRIAASASR